MSCSGAVSSQVTVRGRLAPSPTGLLHVGNAWAFLLAWLEIRFYGGSVILRMEDLDPARSRREWAEAAMRDLAWLGLDWDEGPNLGGGERGAFGPYTQSARTDIYEQALGRLRDAGLVYSCYCTRRELRDLAGAPQKSRAGNVPYSHLESWVGDLGAPYPGFCRNLTPEERHEREVSGRRAALRLACPDHLPPESLFFRDAVLGPYTPGAELIGGDFALRRSDGVWAYQLAVVVDDALMGISHVARGEDILVSTPRQLLLFYLLGSRAPVYAHIPLLHDENGDRLAKRHGSLSLDALRQAGVSPEALVGRLALLAGWSEGGPLRPHELVARLRREHGPVFPWHTLPDGPITIPYTSGVQEGA